MDPALKHPPAVLEWFVRTLIPPAAREAVSGDLWERYVTPRQYFIEGVLLMPYLVASQIRRTSSFAVLALQAFALFACLGGFAIDAPGNIVANWSRAAIPTIAALFVLLLREAYRGRSQGPLLGGIIDASAAAIAVVLTEAALAGLAAAHQIGPGWVLTRPLMILGSLAVPTVGILRIGSGLDVPPRFADGASPDDLVSEYARFARGVRWRNLAEILACLFVIAVGAFFVSRYSIWVAPATWTMLAIWLTLTIYLALRGWARPQPGSPGALRTQYQSELKRQHSLRRVMWWWWFVPLFAGLGTNLIGPGYLNNQPLRLALGCAAMLGLAFSIGKLIHDRGTRTRQEISALEGLAE